MSDEEKFTDPASLLSPEKFEKLRGQLAGTEIDASTPDKPDLQQFTPEQIEEFCKSAKQLCEYNKMPSLVVSLQIIKQLQEEIKTRLQGCDGD